MVLILLFYSFQLTLPILRVFSGTNLTIHTYLIKIVRMKAKLTLSIEKTTLLKAKKLSIRKKKSISRLFEEYVEKNQLSTATPISDSLRGILKKAAGNKSFDELRAEAVKDRYGL